MKATSSQVAFSGGAKRRQRKTITGDSCASQACDEKSVFRLTPSGSAVIDLK
jgi:hypothetical protein